MKIKRILSVPVRFADFVKSKQNNAVALILHQLYIFIFTFCMVYFTFHMQKAVGGSLIRWFFASGNLAVFLFTCALALSVA